MTEPERKKTTELLRSLNVKPALEVRIVESKEAAHIKPVLQARGTQQDDNTHKDE